MVLVTQEYGPPTPPPIDWPPAGGDDEHKHVAVVGSRNYPHTQAQWELMTQAEREESIDVGRSLVVAAVEEFPTEWVVVSGGARGPDTWALDAAVERGMQTLVHLPEWDRYGRSAGFIRNKRIVSVASEVLAFWDGASRGTSHTLKLARKLGRPFYVVGPEGTMVVWDG